MQRFLSTVGADAAQCRRRQLHHNTGVAAGSSARSHNVRRIIRRRPRRSTASGRGQCRAAAPDRLARHDLPSPPFIATFVLIIAIIAQRGYTRPSDPGSHEHATFVGVAMAVLLTVRYFTGDYVEHAEKISSGNWLEPTDTVVVTRWGDSIIGLCNLLVDRRAKVEACADSRVDRETQIPRPRSRTNTASTS